MRIEKISDDQTKYTFKTDDLAEGDMSISELSYSSEKTQQLFQEVIAHIQFENGFSMNNTPVILEAMRVGVDSLVVVATKIKQDNPLYAGEVGLNLLPAARHQCKFKQFFELLHSKKLASEDSYSIFSFDDIELMTAAVLRIPSNFYGESSAYKMYDKLFLVLKNATRDKKTTSELENVLYEYGTKYVSNTLSYQYLVERAEVFIGHDVVAKLRAYAKITDLGEGEYNASFRK